MIKKFTSEFDSRYSFEKALLTGYVFSLVMLLLIGFITYNQMEEFKRTEALVVHTVNVIRQIKEVQTMRRGTEVFYLDKILSGDKNAHIDMDTVIHALDNLKILLDDNPVQINNVDKLRMLIYKRRDDMIKFTTLYKTDKTKAQKFVEKDLMNSFEDIGKQHAMMIGIEDSLLVKRTNDSYSQANQTKTFIGVSSLLGGLIIVLSMIISNKQVSLRNKAEDNLLQINEDLDNMVRARTKELENTNTSLRNEIEIRKETEENLIKTQGRVKRLFETDIIGTFVADLEGLILEANDTFLKMIGYTKEELPIQWKKIIPARNLDTTKERIDYMKKYGHSVPAERQFLCKNGNTISVFIGGALLPEENDKSVSFVLDITKEKIFERKYEEVNKRLHLALKASKAAEWEWDLVNNRIFWSEDLYEIFNKEKAEFDPSIEIWAQLVFAEDRETVREAFRESYKDKSNLDVDFRIVKEDGSIKWLNLTGRFFMNELDIPILMSGLCLDITLKKKDEGLIQLQNAVSKALIDAENEYDILYSIPDSLCSMLNFGLGNFWIREEGKKAFTLKYSVSNGRELDSDISSYSLFNEIQETKAYKWQSFDDYKVKTGFGFPIFVNDEFLGIIECLGKYKIQEEPELKGLLLSIGSQIGSFIEKKIAEKNLKEAKENLEVKVEERTAALNNVLVSLRDEVEVRIQKEEELKKLYYELREMQKEMVHQEKLTALGRFASGIAHEIRNPLANISSLAQFMAKSKTLDDKAKERLDYILININLANKIIKDLLQFASPDDFNFKSGNMNKILNELYESVKSRCDEKEISLKIMLDNSIPEFEINEEKLYSAFLNFITNSIDAVNPGGSVEINSIKNGEHIEILVKDTGMGIPAENLDKIFEPFFTTKDEGTGLGMGLAYSIIKSHHGEIKIESEINKGTTVKIILPLNIQYHGENINS